MRDGTLSDISSQKAKKKKKKKELMFRDTTLNPTEWSGDIGGRCIHILVSLVRRRAGGYRGAKVQSSRPAASSAALTTSEGQTTGDRRGVLML